jgi:chromosome segregation ATPase
MQEMIIQGKHDDLAELVASKQVKIGVLKAKKNELEEEKKQKDHKIKVEDNDIAHKEKKFEHKMAELKALEESIIKLEESLPRPLDDDYNSLTEQNNKINKELLKYEKLAS